MLPASISANTNPWTTTSLQAMKVAWCDKGLPRDRRSVDMVVHSTGALIARNWMTTFFKPDMNPVWNLVMLAPANFGSPLAHKGRSLIGRGAKGEGWSMQVGQHLLRDLEIASRFSWELAMRDRFAGSRGMGPAAHCAQCSSVTPATEVLLR